MTFVHHKATLRAREAGRQLTRGGDAVHTIRAKGSPLSSIQRNTTIGEGSAMAAPSLIFFPAPETLRPVVDFAAEALLWLATGVGLGFLGATLRNAQATTDTDSSYRSAVGLIRRREALAGRLSAGLVAVGIPEPVTE